MVVLQRGRVLCIAATAGLLDALASDAEVDALSGDQNVRSSMAVTNVAIGADQVWAGVNGLPGTTGAGIGVAIIDSGVAPHQALKGRIVASVDFTRTSGRGNAYDEYGHGT